MEEENLSNIQIQVTMAQGDGDFQITQSKAIGMKDPKFYGTTNIYFDKEVNKKRGLYFNNDYSDDTSDFFLNSLIEKRVKLDEELLEYIQRIELNRKQYVIECAQQCKKKWYVNVTEKVINNTFIIGAKMLHGAYGFFSSFSVDMTKKYIDEGAKTGREMAYIILGFLLVLLGDARRAIIKNEFAAFLSENKVGGILFCYLLTITTCQKIIIDDQKELENYILKATNQERIFDNELQIDELIQACNDSFKTFICNKKRVLQDYHSNTAFSKGKALRAKVVLKEIAEDYSDIENQKNKIKQLTTEINSLKLNQNNENTQKKYQKLNHKKVDRVTEDEINSENMEDSTVITENSYQFHSIFSQKTKNNEENQSNSEHGDDELEMNESDDLGMTEDQQIQKNLHYLNLN